MTDTVVVEGQVKLRDGKKWRNRWVVLRKPSPVADCLSLLVYKDKAERHKGHRERSCLTLGDICGLELGLSYEGVGFTLAIISLTQAVLLGFDRRESLLTWDLRIRYSLGEAHRFNVHVLPGTKLETGPATLHLCNNLLVVTRDLPPVVAGQWKLSDLRRYGAVPNGFVFEGGTRCGCWAGVFFLACAEGEQISFLFDCIVRGISPSRSPFGLRPVLPDAGSKASSSEEKIQQEASELERRLSRLSTCSRQSSTASTCSYSTSTAGDDCSMSSSSSEASHSDTSLGSRLTLWPESSRRPLTPLTGSVSSSGAASTSRTPTPTSRRTLTPSLSAEESLYAAVMGGAGGAILRPSSSASSLKLGRGRGLRDAGRQGSTDSGIATTGSHSSYSGSFSSCTGSLDMAAVEAEEFGSLLSLPPSASVSSLLLGPVGVSGTRASVELSCSSSASSSSSCSCSVSTGTTPTPWAHASSSEYQVPLAARDQELPTPPPTPHFPFYDTPRRILPPSALTKDWTGLGGAAGGQDRGAGLREALASAGPPKGFPVPPQAGAPSPNTCPVCRGAKCSHFFDTTYITQEQCVSVRRKCSTQGTDPMQPGGLPSPTPGPSFPERSPSQMSAVCPSAVEHTKEPEMVPGTLEFEERGRYELMGTYAQLQRISRDTEASLLVKPPFFIGSPRLIRQASACAEPKENYERMALTSEAPRRSDLPSGDGGAALPSPVDATRMPPSDRFLGDGINYVNIPISPTSKRQLHYMELDLQDLQEPTAAVRGGGSTKYAQIDITAMEAAQRVGAQHALGREERLQELEQRKKGTMN
ncbi:protein Dok-7 [Sardina pilchardus]|uniref:protein Dok-7 n=1 Tax=Sardina pilchardus TaxID=27697 RepID=UPI002E15DFC9